MAWYCKSYPLGDNSSHYRAAPCLSECEIRGFTTKCDKKVVAIKTPGIPFITVSSHTVPNRTLEELHVYEQYVTSGGNLLKQHHFPRYNLRKIEAKLSVLIKLCKSYGGD